MLMQLSNVRSPKQRPNPTGAWKSWYEYYAGYSPLFVLDMLGHFAISKGESILDPWNGIGTTTQIARETGHDGIGFDLNPAAVIIAKARQLHGGIESSIISLSMEIVDMTKKCCGKCAPPSEPLCTWFASGTAVNLRGLEQSIQHLLVSNGHSRRIIELTSLHLVSDLAAFFYTALFRVVRRLLTRFRSSNPTWVKHKGDPDNRVDLTPHAIFTLFQASVEEMLPRLRKNKSNINSRLDLASSTLLPLPNDSIAAVITSPPYCTRIDYAVTTSPELAVLGMDLSSELKPLRDRMMGTSTIGNTPQKANDRWGPTCRDLVGQIKNHHSKAASSYYLKTYLQYFNSLQLSIAEISRVLKIDGKAALVVQDSYFKDVRVDLASITAEMGCQMKLIPTDRIDFPAQRTMGALHKHVRKYRKSATATESVVILSKQ